MKFWEAMKAMQEGKKVRRSGWYDKDDYLYIDEDTYIRDKYGNYTQICSLGETDNWEIYEEKKEVDPRFKEFYQYLKDERGFVNNQYTDYINDHNEPDYLLKFYQQLLEMAKYYKLD